MDVSEDVGLRLPKKCFFDVDGKDTVNCENSHRKTINLHVYQAFDHLRYRQKVRRCILLRVELKSPHLEFMRKVARLRCKVGRICGEVGTLIPFLNI